jgi:hypothetical protein
MATHELQHDLACVRCGYNLRGLSDAGTCPECGTLISHSLMGWSPRYAAPEWRRRVKRGLAFLQWSLGAILLWPIAIIVAFFIEGVACRSERLPVAEHLLEMSPLIGAVAALLGCTGILWTTSPEAAESADPSRRRARRLTRWTSLAIVAVASSLIAAHRLPVRLAGGVKTSLWISGAILLGLLGFGFSRWLVAMYRRIQPEMVGWARTAAVLILCFTACVAAYSISLGVAFLSGYNALLSDLVGCLVVLVIALGLASLGLVVLLIRTLRRQLREVSSYSDLHKGAEP